MNQNRFDIPQSKCSPLQAWCQYPFRGMADWLVSNSVNFIESLSGEKGKQKRKNREFWKFVLYDFVNLPNGIARPGERKTWLS
jgi:hypothetical protein